MAVVTLFMSDRDTSKTFTDKKEADQYDKMLELAENVSAWMEQEITGLSEEQVEQIGMLIAKNKDVMTQALKGKPEVLLSSNQSTDAKEDSDVDSRSNATGEKVTPIAANN